MNKSGTISVFMLSRLGVTVYQPDGLLRPILLVALNYIFLHHLVIVVDQFAFCTTKTGNGKTVCMRSKKTQHLMNITDLLGNQDCLVGHTSLVEYNHVTRHEI